MDEWVDKFLCCKWEHALGHNGNLQFAINWMRSRNLGFQVEMRIVWNSFFPILWNSIQFQGFPFQCLPILTEVPPFTAMLLLTDPGLFFTLSLSRSLQRMFNFAWIEFARIAERGLAPDPLHPPMKSNCISIPASTSTTKSPVFVAKLENWKMYSTIVPTFLFLFLFFLLIVFFFFDS